MDKSLSHLRTFAGTLIVVAGTAFAGFFGAADSTLTSALTSVTSYFTDNVGVVIAAVVGIAALIWLLRLAFRSFGIRKPTSVN